MTALSDSQSSQLELDFLLERCSLDMGNELREEKQTKDKKKNNDNNTCCVCSSFRLICMLRPIRRGES